MGVELLAALGLGAAAASTAGAAAGATAAGAAAGTAAAGAAAGGTAAALGAAGAGTAAGAAGAGAIGAGTAAGVGGAAAAGPMLASTAPVVGSMPAATGAALTAAPEIGLGALPGAAGSGTAPLSVTGAQLATAAPSASAGGSGATGTAMSKLAYGPSFSGPLSPPPGSIPLTMPAEPGGFLSSLYPKGASPLENALLTGQIGSAGSSLARSFMGGKGAPPQHASAGRGGSAPRPTAESAMARLSQREAERRRRRG